MKKKTISKIKRTITNIIFPIAVIITFVLVLGRVGYWENHYTMTAEVVEINNESVYIKDENGELWEGLFDEHDFAVGDVVKVTMFNNHTDLNIYDDAIEKMEKIF